MSRPGIPEVHLEYAGRSVEDNIGVFPADRTPIETYPEVRNLITRLKKMDALTFHQPFLRVIRQPFSCHPLAISSL